MANFTGAAAFGGGVHPCLTVTHKDITKRIRIRRGCPQGGILSPFLWILVVDDLLKFSAKEIPGYLQAFADDLVTLAEGSDTGVIWQRTQKTINTIEYREMVRHQRTQHKRT